MKKFILFNLALFLSFSLSYSNEKNISQSSIITIKAELTDKCCSLEPKNEKDSFFLKLNKNLELLFNYYDNLNKPKISINFDSKNKILKQNNEILEKIISYKKNNSLITLNTNKKGNIKNFKNGYIYMNITIE